MRMPSSLIYAGCFVGVTVLAQSPVTLSIDTRSPGYAIPDDFAGVSIFTRTQMRDHRGVPGNLFSGTNAQLIALFKNTGLHHLRLGATGSPTSSTTNLSHADIDSLFAFAKATDIKVIYSLHFADGPATAKYVWERYRPYLDYFAFDNEPDSRLNEDSGKPGTDHKNYFESWRDFAKAVTTAVPGAKFAGAGRGRQDPGGAFRQSRKGFRLPRPGDTAHLCGRKSPEAEYRDAASHWGDAVKRLGH